MRRRLLFTVVAVALSYVLLAGYVGFADQGAKPGAASLSAPAPNARIDINTASLDDLMKTPGMTRTWAARIIRFRPYRAKNDLVDKGIVSNQVYEHIKDYIIAHRVNQ